MPTNLELKINELKKLHPTLTKGINAEIVTLTAIEYDQTIEAWAQELLSNPIKPPIWER